MASKVKLTIYSVEAKPVREAELPAKVTSQAIKPALVHQVTVAYAANSRAGTAHTKTRDEVRGGGKKPWKQKGTGRARHGSIRSPLWVGGGVVHGPRKTRNWQQRLPDQLKTGALAMVVADYLTSGRVTVVETWPAEPKTKVFAKLLRSLKLSGSVLALLTDTEREARRGLLNLPRVEVQGVRQLNAYDGLRRSRWVVSSQGLEQLYKLVR